MSSKKFIGFILIFSFVMGGLIGIINWVIDPFQQYRVDTFYPISYDTDKQRYKNGGFAKNFSYDSLILGTSMTENFILSEVEEELNFKKAIKLSISGGSAKEQSITLGTAITNNKNLKNVLWGLDTFVFFGEEDNLAYGEGSFPFYLYDSNYFNDYEYLLSINTLKASGEALVNPHLINDKVIYDQNRMYQWQHNFPNSFTQENVQNAWDNREEFLNFEEDKQTFLYMRNSFDTNFLQIIKNNPQIHFKVFFPPYSILVFKVFEEREQMIDVLEFKKYVYHCLLECKNVTLYDFQTTSKTTTNLDNYKDLTHYHQKINTWILEQIKVKKYLVTKENIDQHLQNLRDQIQAYNLKE